MGLNDMVTRDYMSDNRIFADVLNYFIYGGDRVIKPENLKPLDTKYTELPFGSSGVSSPVERVRDLLRRLVLKRSDDIIYVMQRTAIGILYTNSKNCLLIEINNRLTVKPSGYLLYHELTESQ